MSGKKAGHNTPPNSSIISEHHHLRYQAIKELDTQTRSKQVAFTNDTNSSTALQPKTGAAIGGSATTSNTQDYLNLIHPDYHYGGETGKTHTNDLYPET